MNFCLKCQSLYSEPGTCNCFAPQSVKIETVGSPGEYELKCYFCGALYRGTHHCPQLGFSYTPTVVHA